MTNKLLKQIKDRELHRITSTAIIYNDQGKFLILKRSPDKNAFPNKWTVPGGGLEVDDYIDLPKNDGGLWYFAIEKSLQREVKEECNLEVGKARYLLDITFIKPNGTPVIILSFYCKYKSGEVKLDEDNVEYAWVSYEEAKDYDLIDGILGELEMVDRILKGEDLEKIEYSGK
jgi:8-oxo-dGTP pyrophosphatase MutT (NUDIX family)